MQESGSRRHPTSLAMAIAISKVARRKDLTLRVSCAFFDLWHQTKHQTERRHGRDREENATACSNCNTINHKLDQILQIYWISQINPPNYFAPIHFNRTMHQPCNVAKARSCSSAAASRSPTSKVSQLRRKRFFVLLRILLKRLERDDPEGYERAKEVSIIWSTCVLNRVMHFQSLVLLYLPRVLS